MYFECAESKNEVVHEVRELTGQAEEMIREKQEEIAADPKQHKAIMEDFKIALDF